jgi:hypothetical protein
MKVNAEILNKLLANKIQKHIKKIISHDQVGFTIGKKGWLNSQINKHNIAHKQNKHQKLHDHLNRCRKSL